MENIEMWKDVPDFKGYYQASNLGRIKALKRNIKQKNRIVTYPEKILKPSKSRGYNFVKLYNGSLKKCPSVHRVIAETFLDKPINKNCVNHINGIKDDNRVKNLEWCTHNENVKHAYKTGLTKIRNGEEIHSSLLKSEDVLKIRELYKLGNISQSQLAKKFNTSLSNINSILTRKSWKHI